MDTTITIPTPEEIARRIRACRAEMAALRRLHRLSKAAQAAKEAQARREPTTAPIAIHVMEAAHA